MQNQLPVCAKCKKPIDEMYRYERIVDGLMVFVAKCHGEKEETLLFPSDAALALSIIPGVAFQTAKQLGE